MERKEHKPLLNPKTRAVLKQITEFQLRQLHTRKEDLWEGMKALEPELGSDLVDQRALLEMLMRANVRLNELNTLTKYVINFPNAADELLQTGLAIQLPEEVGRSFHRNLSKDWVTSSSKDLTDNQFFTIEDPTIEVSKHGYIRYILAGEQLALEVKYGRANQELGTIEPTVEPTEYNLIRAQDRH